MKTYFKYLWYVLKHKWHILHFARKLGIKWRGITHDLSKLLPSEFFPMAEFFYGCKKPLGVAPENIRKANDSAVALHHSRNRHHPEFFKMHGYEDEDLLWIWGKPCDDDITEMIADWCAMERAKHPDQSTHWYIASAGLWFMENKSGDLPESLVKRIQARINELLRQFSLPPEHPNCRSMI